MNAKRKDDAVSGKKGIFITGTDTGVGKTLITGMLGRLLKESGAEVVTQKWVQAGCADGKDLDLHMSIMKTGGGNSANTLKSASSLRSRNPYCLEFAASPHLAAEKENISILPGKLMSAYRELTAEYEFVLVEGSGGLLVPYCRKGLLVDIVRELKLPVLVVALNRLGAINHTLMTLEALRSRDMRITGLILNNGIPGENETILEDNIRVISEISGIETTGALSYQPDIDVLYSEFRPLGLEIIRNTWGKEK